MNEIIQWITESLHLLDIVSTVLGVVYLWLEYKANIWLWVVGVVMPIVHGVLYLKAGLYADFGMEFFYVMVAFYGAWMWLNMKRRAQSVAPTGDVERKEAAAIGVEHSALITRFPQRLILPTAVAFVAIWAMIYAFLVLVTDSTVPVLDAFTTALSIVAYWALARKWAEQWLLWLVVDAVCTPLYIYKGIPFTAALYGINTIAAIFGYRKWLSMVKG